MSPANGRVATLGGLGTSQEPEEHLQIPQDQIYFGQLIVALPTLKSTIGFWRMMTAPALEQT